MTTQPPLRCPMFPGYIALSLCLFVPWICGCVEGRSSTHELEHVVPEHWPLNLADAADKIENRLESITSSPGTAVQVSVELKEIIEWLPEVAADTTMHEPQWDLIYAECTQIESTMRGTGDIKKSAEALRAFCQRLRDMDRQLADRDSLDSPK